MRDSEFTPTTEQASRAYVTGMRQAFIASAGEHAEEFARFLAARDASIRAAALDEAADVVERKVTPLMYFGSDGEFFASAIRALKEEK